MINVKDSYLLAVIFTALSLLSACSGNNSSDPELLNTPQPHKSVAVETTVDINYVFVGVGGELTYYSETDVRTSNRQGRISNTSKTIYDSSRIIPEEFGFEDPAGGPYLVIKSFNKANDNTDFQLSSSNYIGKDGLSILSFTDNMYDLAETNTFDTSRNSGDTSYKIGKLDISSTTSILYDRNTHNEIGTFSFTTRDTPIQVESVIVQAGSYTALKFQFESTSRSLINGDIETESWAGHYWIDVNTGQLVRIAKSGRKYYSSEGLTYSLVEVRELIERKQPQLPESSRQPTAVPRLQLKSLL